MSAFDEQSMKQQATTHVVGGDLSPLSVDELTARITILRVEIERLEVEREKKAAGRRSAETLFRS